MFDVGFSELVVIGVVALVVVGPERLPAVARTAGALFGRARRYANELKADIQNQVDVEEIKRIEATFYDATKSIEHSIGQVREELGAAAGSLTQDISVLSETPSLAGAEQSGAPAQQDLGPVCAAAGECAPAPRI